LIARVEKPGGFTVVGLKVVATLAGSPSALRATLPIDPGGASTETEKAAVSPCLTLAVAGSTLRANASPAVTLTVFVFSARRVVPDTIS
jgi:hypothetical protein